MDSCTIIGVLVCSTLLLSHYVSYIQVQNTSITCLFLRAIEGCILIHLSQRTETVEATLQHLAVRLLQWTCTDSKRHAVLLLLAPAVGWGEQLLPPLCANSSFFFDVQSVCIILDASLPPLSTTATHIKHKHKHVVRSPPTGGRERRTCNAVVLDSVS